MSHSALETSQFRRFVELNAAHELDCGDARRRGARAALVVAAETGLAQGSAQLLGRIPTHIAAAMGELGWVWNGFYVLGEDARLHLGPACGPPVCTPLESSGGALSSGMCFDALALNQTLVAYDAKVWPGYVSCDATSGLATAAGIVVPLRDPAGRPLAVWDLDSSEPLEPGDVRFMDVLFSTICRCVELSRASFGM